jgi:hypothetical protein
VKPFSLMALQKPQVIAVDQLQDVFLGSMANSRRLSTDIFQGKNGLMSDRA